jgi:hypothetical protein
MTLVRISLRQGTSPEYRKARHRSVCRHVSPERQLLRASQQRAGLVLDINIATSPDPSAGAKQWKR